ncbi:alpha/beta fold hydrolase [Rhodococcus sp. 15-649-2-2]|uniref:alpha/beta fold hydrolase n=1 Tax=Rhodococcus sp. 15-649-2-2 TaxID=2023140 RepID=UPI0015C5C202|nr:alpha/beta fold hydrolase [Rhodococcus sp. 15-649-2-2]
MRLLSVTFALSVLVGSLVLSAAPVSAAPVSAAPVSAAPGSADFYGAPVADLEAYAPGSIVRREPVPQLDLLGSHTERILYRSADPRDRAVAVSGLLVTPTRAWAGPGPRPVIAYAPGSYGIADRCSGSSELGLTTTMPALLPLLAQGYQVVTTDYQGLGTPGEYEFLGRVASARALLDSARAAARETDAPVVLYGYSAGGVASAAAAELASTYAPDVSVVGAFVGAAPTDPVVRVEGQDGSAWAATMLYTIDGLIGAHPDQADRIRALFNDRGRAALDAALDFCNTDALGYGSLRSEDLTADGTSLSALMLGPVLGPLTAANTIGFTAPVAPVMIVHGIHDRSVEIEQSRLLTQRWRAAGGTDITVREFDFGTDLVPAVDHTATNIAAYPELLEWIDRLVAQA